MFVIGDVIETNTRDFLSKTRVAHISKTINIEPVEGGEQPYTDQRPRAVTNLTWRKKHRRKLLEILPELSSSSWWQEVSLGISKNLRVPEVN